MKQKTLMTVAVMSEIGSRAYCIPYWYTSAGAPSRVVADTTDTHNDNVMGYNPMERPPIKNSDVVSSLPVPLALYSPTARDSTKTRTKIT